MNNNNQTAFQTLTSGLRTPIKKTFEPTGIKTDRPVILQADTTAPKQAKISPSFPFGEEDTVNYKRPKAKNQVQRGKIELKDSNNRWHSFPLYTDAELGIDRDHQTRIHASKNDDDCMSDEEQIINSAKYCAYQVKEGVKKERRSNPDFDVSSDDSENKCEPEFGCNCDRYSSKPTR